MTTYLLDSTVYIHIEKQVPEALAWLAALAEEDVVGTTPVNIGEVVAGSHATDVDWWETFFAEADVWPITAAHGLWAGKRIGELRRRGVRVKLADALIAAVAVSREAIVATANVRDFVALGVAVHGLDRADG